MKVKTSGNNTFRRPRLSGAQHFPSVTILKSPLITVVLWASTWCAADEIRMEYRYYPSPQLPNLHVTDDAIVFREAHYTPSKIYVGVGQEILPAPVRVVERAVSDPLVNVVKNYYSALVENHPELYKSTLLDTDHWNVHFGHERRRLTSVFTDIPENLFIQEHFQFGKLHLYNLALTDNQHRDILGLDVLDVQPSARARLGGFDVDRLLLRLKFTLDAPPPGFSPVSPETLETGYIRVDLPYVDDGKPLEEYPLKVYFQNIVPAWGRVVADKGAFVVDPSESAHEGTPHYELIRFYRDTMATYLALPKEGFVSKDDPAVVSLLSRYTPQSREWLLEKIGNDSALPTLERHLRPVFFNPKMYHEIVGIVDSDPYFYFVYSDLYVTHPEWDSSTVQWYGYAFKQTVVREGSTFRMHIRYDTGPNEDLFSETIFTKALFSDLERVLAERK